MKTRSFLLAAGLVLAMAFIFSCGQHELDDGGGGNSFSYCLISGQCLDGPFTSKECGDLGGLPSNSNSCTGGGGGNPSSSSGGNPGGNVSSCPVSAVSDNSVTCGGQTYRTVQIGTQKWFAENLNYNASGSKCFYDDPNCTEYGRRYDWATAMALPSSCNSNSCSSQIQSKHRGICPSGWHIPSDADWDALMTTVGGSSTAGTKMKATRNNGTDEYGFSALLYESYADWWSASERNSNSANCWGMGNYSYVDNSCNGKSTTYSVRCLQDNTGGGGGGNPSSSSNGGQGGGGNGGPTNWTAVSDSPFGTNTIWGVAYGNNTWVAVDGKGKIAYSADGRNWTAASVNIFPYLDDVAFGAGVFVAVGAGRKAYSSDGISWTQCSGNSDITDNSIDYVNDMFIAAGDLGRMAYSTDGINWTFVTAADVFNAGTNQNINGFAFGSNRIVGVCAGGKIGYSTDGASWTAVSNGTFGTTQINDIAYGNNRFFAVGKDGKAAYSTDGVTWTAVANSGFGTTAINDIAYGNNRFFAVGAGGKAAYSTDGVTWTAVGNSGFGTTAIHDVAYGNGRFVAVGEQGKIAYAEW